jgi:acyl-CoA reductase-like NAD-dependent aldehyde dehydrogenase
MLAREAGLPDGVLGLLPEEPEAARQAIALGMDKVLLTGSAATGRDVLAQLAPHLTPATMELSGDDAVFVLPGADLDRLVRAVRFGTTLNGGATCIAPRRVFAPRDLAERLREPLAPTGVDLVPVTGPAQALREAARSPYALGAAVFGPERQALALAAQVRAGVVVINDVIVPTADPRLPFGGRGESGYGVTRGAEGLLELTVPKVVAVRRGRRRPPHLEAPHPGDADLFRAFLALAHGRGFGDRLRGAMALLRAAARRGRPSGPGRRP